MDDQVQNQTSQQTQNLPDAQQVQPQVTQVISVTQTGSYQKEAEPLTSAEPLIRPSEAEPVISKEVGEAGVEAVSEKPKLTEDHEKIGIRHAKESTQVVTQPTGAVSLPMTMEEVAVELKTDKDTKSSRHWLAVLVRKIFKQMQFSSPKAKEQ